MKHKYHAVETTCNQGHVHPSKKEAKRCDELHLLERAGAIHNLEIQPVFHFPINGSTLEMRNGHKAKYTADFAYFEGSQHVVEDTKGFITADFRLRSALFRHIYPKTDLRVL